MSRFHCLHCRGEYDDSSAIADTDGNKFCCSGCKNAYEFLNANGFGEFYQRLGKNSHFKAKDNALSDAATQSFYKNYVKSDGLFNEIYLVIEGIHCSACIWLNEKVLFQTDGIVEVSINSATSKAHIKWDESRVSLGEILNKIKLIGYTPIPYDPTKSEAIVSQKRRDFYAKMLVGIFCTMNIMWVGVALYGGYFSGMNDDVKNILHFAEFVLASPVLFYTGSEFFRSAYFGLKNHQVGLDLSVAGGATIAYFYSVYAMLWRSGEVYFDSVAMIITFVFIGKFLEVLSKKRAIDHLDSLSSMLVDEICVKLGDKFELKSVDEVVVGDIILVRVGERTQIDGVVISGAGSFDYSSISGESLPVFLKDGDEITSGAVCIDGSLTYRAIRSFKGSMLSKIINLLENASLKKPSIEKLANKISAKFSVAILSLGLLTFLFWALSGADVSKAIITAVSVIIIACPCALSLATPVASLVGLGVGLNKKIIFKEAKIIESLAKCKNIVFDKTGTLSLSKLKVVKVTKLKEFDENLLYSILSVSNHPVSSGVRQFISGEAYDLQDVHSVISKGVRAKFGDINIYGGSAEYMLELGFGEVKSFDSTYCFAIENEIVAVFELRDELRQEAKDVISELKKSKYNIIMLTGDNKNVAKRVAKELGIDKVYSQVSPLQKANLIEKLNAKTPTIMVGDGINDAIALSRASVGICVGSAAAVSIQKSDVVLLDNSLHSLLYALKISRATYSTIKQNLLFSLLYNLITIPIAMAGYIIPLFAAISMSLSSVIVVLNSAKIRMQFKG